VPKAAVLQLLEFSFLGRMASRPQWDVAAALFLPLLEVLAHSCTNPALVSPECASHRRTSDHEGLVKMSGAASCARALLQDEDEDEYLEGKNREVHWHDFILARVRQKGGNWGKAGCAERKTHSRTDFSTTIQKQRGF